MAGPRKSKKADSGASSSQNLPATVGDIPPMGLTQTLARSKGASPLALMTDVDMLEELRADLCERYDRIMALPEGSMSETDKLRMGMVFTEQLLKIAERKTTVTKAAIDNATAIKANITPDQVPEVVDRIVEIVSRSIKKHVPRQYQQALQIEIADELRSLASSITSRRD